MGLKIVSTSSYLPENLVSNIDLESKLDTNDEWIYKRTGIKNRHISLDEDTTILGVKACKKLDISGVKNKIRAVICATSTSENIMPNLASIVHRELDLDENCFSMDINMACSGFVAGLTTIEGLLKEGEYGIILGTEVLSKMVNWDDRTTAILFGDGAGALLVEKTSETMYSDFGTIGDTGSLEYGGLNLDREVSLLKMDGREVYKFAVDTIPKSINKLLKKSDLVLEDIDYIVSHQANKRILEKSSKTLKIPEEKFYSNIEKMGNTSSASVPLVLDEMNEKNMLKGKKIILIGFGAGLTWVSTILTG